MIIALWILVFMVALLQGYWLAVIAVVTWFSYWHPSWWLFLAVVLIDGYFGSFYTVPVLSLVFGGFVLLVETLKIQLLGAQKK
jgi:hypothetical protein